MRIRDAGDRLSVFAKSAEHVPAVLVNLLGGRRRAVLGEHAASGFKGLSRRGWRFLGQLSEPCLEGETLRRCFSLQHNGLTVGYFNHGHGKDTDTVEAQVGRLTITDPRNKRDRFSSTRYKRYAPRPCPAAVVILG
jgi:hypothetical protein